VLEAAQQVAAEGCGGGGAGSREPGEPLGHQRQHCGRGAEQPEEERDEPVLAGAGAERPCEDERAEQHEQATEVEEQLAVTTEGHPRLLVAIGASLPLVAHLGCGHRRT
jgi:hypothetical protein